MRTQIERKTMEKILEKLDQRLCPEFVLRAAGKRLGLPETTPYYDGRRWLKKECESPVFDQLLGMLRRTNPYGAGLWGRRQIEERGGYFAEANLIEMLKLSCTSGGRPDLSGVDLSELDLSFVSLKGVILSHPGIPGGEQEETGKNRTGLYANLTGTILRKETCPEDRKTPQALLTPNHGSLYHVAPSSQKVRLSVYDKRDGALYFYCLRDKETFYCCGYSFPEVASPERVKAFHADWGTKRLAVCESDGIRFYHLISGKGICVSGREFISYPAGLDIKRAEFGPDGKSVDLICGDLDEQKCFRWDIFGNAENIRPYPALPEQRQIHRIAPESFDVERGVDSKRRFYVTGPEYYYENAEEERQADLNPGRTLRKKFGELAEAAVKFYTDETQVSDEYQEECVFFIEDGGVRKFPALGDYVSPCVFHSNGIAGITDRGDAFWEGASFEKLRLWAEKKKAMKNERAGKIFFEEEDETELPDMRTVIWYNGEPGKRSWMPDMKKSRSCTTGESMFYYGSSYAAFDDGILEINGRTVFHYVVTPKKITCHAGEPDCGGWRLGCPGLE